MRTVVHIGYHKTATKLLQTEVFPRLENCNIVSPATSPFTEFFPIATNLCDATEGELAESALRAFLDDLRHPDRTLLVSFEDFTARDYEGRTAERLQRSVPDAHVFVCVREQGSMALSTYSQLLRGLDTRSYGEWVAVLAARDLVFRYDELVARYQHVFGAHRVHVLAYEQLATDPRWFVDQVRAVVDPDAASFEISGPLPVVNVGMTRPTRAAVHAANRLLIRGDLLEPNSLQPRFRHGPDPKVVAATIQRLCARLLPNAPAGPGRRDRRLTDEFATRYAESNARLGHLTGLPLRDLGYVVGDRPRAGT